MSIKKIIKPIIVVVTAISLMFGLAAFVTPISNAQNIDSNIDSKLYDQLSEKLKKFGSVEVITTIADDDYESNLKRLSEYAVKHQKLFGPLFTGGRQPLVTKKPLPSVYEEEIKKVTDRLNKYPEIAKSTKFNQFSPHISTTIKSQEMLKELFNVLKPKMENELSTTQLNNSIPAIGADKSWLRDASNVSVPDSGANGEGVNKIIAILDTGVDKTHPFLAGKVTMEGCFSLTTASSASVCPDGSNKQYGFGTGVPCTGSSSCSHGTHVAGIAAGLNGSNQKVRFNGVARRADIASLQVFSKINSATTCSSYGASAPCVLSYASSQIDALSYVGLGVLIQAIFNSPKRLAVSNMSLGGNNNTSNCDSDSRKNIIDTLKSVGVATVIAAGNSGAYGVATPACISSAIAVSSTDTSATPVSAGSSQFHQLLTDISAPGANILSSIPGGTYQTKGGTSMAAPHVAGAFAILKGIFPTHSVDTNLNVLNAVSKPYSVTKAGTTYPAKRLVLCRDYYFTFGIWNCSPRIWFPYDLFIHDLVIKKL